MLNIPASFLLLPEWHKPSLDALNVYFLVPPVLTRSEHGLCFYYVNMGLIVTKTLQQIIDFNQNIYWIYLDVLAEIYVWKRSLFPPTHLILLHYLHNFIEFLVRLFSFLTHPLLLLQYHTVPTVSFYVVLFWRLVFKAVFTHELASIFCIIWLQVSIKPVGIFVLFSNTWKVV